MLAKEEKLSARERDVLRAATIFSYIGWLSDDSQTSKVHTYSFLGAHMLVDWADQFNAKVADAEDAKEQLKKSRQLLRPGTICQKDKLFEDEEGKPTVLIQSHFRLEDVFRALDLEPGSTFELIFKLVMFGNSLPTFRGGKKIEVVVKLRTSERNQVLSPQILYLMGHLKVADYLSRRLLSVDSNTTQTDKQLIYSLYHRLALKWSRSALD